MAIVALRASQQQPRPNYPDWQTALADAVRDPAELCRLVGIDSSPADRIEQFPLLVPRTFLGRIRPGDPTDPLLVQVLPQAAERAEVPGYHIDPLGEACAAFGPGLLWKYRGRILMVASPRCAVHCRYCFRRHFPYHDSACKPADWDAALGRIAADDSIHEVILSGGDPLTLSDAQLAGLIERLAEISQLRRLRLHTRLPVMIPQRVTDDLLAILQSGRLPTMMVIQVNHPAEIDAAVAGAIGRLVASGTLVLNQSVLLAGVNDRLEVLAELCEKLIELRVVPYYLHQLDSVAGAAHFEVPLAVGVKLIAALRARLPGYAVPRYVRETPGGVSKEILA